MVLLNYPRLSQSTLPSLFSPFSSFPTNFHHRRPEKTPTAYHLCLSYSLSLLAELRHGRRVRRLRLSPSHNCDFLPIRTLSLSLPFLLRFTTASHHRRCSGLPTPQLPNQQTPNLTLHIYSDLVTQSAKQNKSSHFPSN